MDLEAITSGKRPPKDVNVVIEIALGGQPVKYEIDKASGALFVDRFLHAAMSYPCNYGFIPHTLADDGDPVDVLVVSPVPLLPGSVVRCRPVGLLRMHDEAGEDAKVLGLPVDELRPFYQGIRNYRQLPHMLLDQIVHFFKHYKDLEPGKWVRVEAWEDDRQAETYIIDALQQAPST